MVTRISRVDNVVGEIPQLWTGEYEVFPNIVHPQELKESYNVTKLHPLEGVHRLVMLDRYSLRDNKLGTLKVGDTVVVEIVSHPEFPTQGYGKVKAIMGGNIRVGIEYPEQVKVDEKPLDLDNLVVTLDRVVKPLETHWEQICARASRGVASVEQTKELRNFWEHKFFWMLSNMYAVPGGRILYGAGSGIDVTLFNCFVLKAIADSRTGISKHRETTMEIMARGGGVGSNGSTLRPKDTIVRKVNGRSSGSVSWLGDLANLTNLVQQGGSRRGAQMIALGDWHPDLIYFILCKIQRADVLERILAEIDDKYIKSVVESYIKRDAKGNAIGVANTSFMTGANISVLVSDDLMEAVERDGDWTLRFPDIANFNEEEALAYENDWANLGDVRDWEAKGYKVKEYQTLKAKDIWKLINIAARYSAEPGILFIDEAQNQSNSYYYSKIVVSNPCGEQPLPANAVCNLIAVNLEKVYNPKTNDVDWELLREILIVSQRFADNVIDHSYYFLEENKKMALGERGIGKGVMGLADLMIKMQQRYGSEEMLEKTDKLFEFIKVESYKASADLAEEKGSFPFYNRDLFLKSGFMKKMPKEVREIIYKKGIRNVCSLTVAPTGSTGTMVGVSTGLEPYFSFSYFRSGRLGKDIEINTPIAQRFFNENPEATELPDYYVSSKDITPKEHVDVQSVIQNHTDSAISKTCNAPSTFTVEDNMELYMRAWKGGCKGVTVYVDGSRDSQVLNHKKEESSEKIEEVAEVSSEPKELVMESTKVCKITLDTLGNRNVECS